MFLRLNYLMLLLSALLFVHCGPHRYPPQLVLLDSLADHKLDSAVTLMRQLEPVMSDASEYDRRYFQLLCVKVADKADLPLPSDTVAWDIVRYYEEDGDSRLLPMAYYYAARIFRTQNDAPQALDYLLKANELLDDSRPRLKGVVNSQMGYLFSQQKLYRNAVDAFKEAYRCDSINNDTIGFIYDLTEIGFNYENINQRDSSIICMERAMALAFLSNETDMVFMLKTQMANIQRLLGNQLEAQKLIHESITFDDPQNRSAVYSIAADIYKSANMADSALYCYNVLTKLTSIYAQRAGYRGLYQYHSERNNYKEEQYNYVRYRECSDSIEKITATAVVAQMNSLYNYKLREEESKRLRKERDDSRRLLQIIGTSALFLMLSIIIALFYFRHKNLVLKIRIERKKRVETAIKLASFTEEYAHMEEELAKSHIAIRIKKILNDPDNVNKLLSEDDWTELERLIERLYPDFRERILEVSKLTSFKLHICLLLKAKIAIADIALLTQHSAEAITSARRRMAQKAFGENSTPVEWDDFIKSL